MPADLARIHFDEIPRFPELGSRPQPRQYTDVLGKSSISGAGGGGGGRVNRGKFLVLQSRRTTRAASTLSGSAVFVPVSKA